MPWFSCDRAALAMDVSPRTIRNYAEQGRLKSRRGMGRNGRPRVEVFVEDDSIRQQATNDEDGAKECPLGRFCIFGVESSCGAPDLSGVRKAPCTNFEVDSKTIDQYPGGVSQLVEDVLNRYGIEIAATDPTLYSLDDLREAIKDKLGESPSRRHFILRVTNIDDSRDGIRVVLPGDRLRDATEQDVSLWFSELKGAPDEGCVVTVELVDYRTGSPIPAAPRAHVVIGGNNGILITGIAT